MIRGEVKKSDLEKRYKVYGMRKGEREVIRFSDAIDFLFWEVTQKKRGICVTVSTLHS